MKKLRAKNDLLFLSKEEDRVNEGLFDESTPSPKESLIENESDPARPVPKHTNLVTSTGSKEKESHSDTNIESKDECNYCTLVLDHPYPIKEDDRIYINRQIGEVLIFPPDESQDESWVQDCIINRRNESRKEDSVFYSKSDSVKLEQFLRREQEGAAIIFIKKCLEHSKPSEACNILSKK